MASITQYGTWPSTLSAADVAAGSLRLELVAADGGDVYWLEGRPAEGGRIVLVRSRADGVVADVTPSGVNVRTRVNEYGGGACLISAGVVFYSAFADQRVYQLEPDGVPVAITPPGERFYADAAMHPSRRWLVCVREDHTVPGQEAITTIVRIPLDGGEHAGEVVASGYDFYSTPRFSHDGTRMTWVCWRHPQMPWDGTEVWVADVALDGGLHGATCVAGGPRESIVQPGWSPEGLLYFVSDRSGWWNLYRLSATDGIEAVCPMDTEFAEPQWQFGRSSWGFASPSRLVVSHGRAGVRRLGAIDLSTSALTALAPDIEPGSVLCVTPTHVACIARSPHAPEAVVRIDLASGSIETLRVAGNRVLAPSQVSAAEPFEFPTDNGATAYGFYYAPRNPEHVAPAGERPPLIVISHGGPTAAATTRLNLEVQYWTARGFAVVDVDYRGSTGYGRPYREALNGEWGISDVADCVNAARFLVAEGKADARRLIIRGASAGGYTTLAALTWHPDVFTAGASYYGICDLEVLQQDTHKFESKYNDSLLGPYREARDVYRARSPIHFVDRLSCPMILLQGLEDKVVPPNQAEMMAEAVRAKGLPVVLLLFEGEQHGFRKTETIVRSLEAELTFYQQVFGDVA